MPKPLDPELALLEQAHVCTWASQREVQNYFSISALLQLEQPNKEESFQQLQHTRTNSWGWKQREREQNTRRDFSETHYHGRVKYTKFNPSALQLSPLLRFWLSHRWKKKPQTQLKTLLKFSSAQAAMAGVFPPGIAAQESGRMCLQLCSPNNRSLLVPPAKRGEEGILQAGPYKQLPARVNSWKLRQIILKIERAAGDQHVKIRTRWQTGANTFIYRINFYSSQGLGLRKPSAWPTSLGSPEVKSCLVFGLMQEISFNDNLQLALE